MVLPRCHYTCIIPPLRSTVRRLQTLRLGGAVTVPLRNILYRQSRKSHEEVNVQKNFMQHIYSIIIMYLLTGITMAAVITPWQMTD